MTNMDKVALRKELIKKRKELTTEYRIKSSDKILDKLFESEEYIKADIILVYADSNGEVATDRLILKSLLNGKRIFAPVCEDNFSMNFYEIFSLDEMYPSTYGIREPLPIENFKLSDAKITDNTLIVVPGVAFDKNNNRMGYGKGYYDRYLSRVDIKHRIGLAYKFQVVDKLEYSETDIPMTRIISN